MTYRNIINGLIYLSSTIVTFGGITFMSVSAQATYRLDFSSGIPNDVKLYDLDGNTLSTESERFGFTPDKPWIAVKEPGTDNMIAASTSWYTTPGTADDWMILPAQQIDDNTILSWRAMAADREFADGYGVYVSTIGDHPEDFNFDGTVFYTKAEEGDWITHSVSLAEYAGQQVWIAFVNNSTDKSRLYIDDIAVGQNTEAQIDCRISNIVTSCTPLYPSGNITSTTDRLLTHIRIGLDSGYGTEWTTLDGLELLPGESVEYTLPLSIQPISNHTLTYTLILESDSEPIVTEQRQVTALVNRVLCEEQTGTWCGFCVRGIVRMGEMKELYPDQFVGIAAHYNDVMAVSEYVSQLRKLDKEDLPTMILMRDKSMMGDPNNMEALTTLALSRKPVAGMEVTAEYEAETGMINAASSLLFADSATGEDYTIAYLVTENDVEVRGNADYMQHNNYSGTDIEMGGWEDKPRIVADMVHQEVMRGMGTDFNGLPDCLPQEINPMELISHNHNFEMPATVLDIANTELTAVLLDKTGKVINVARCAITGTQNTVIEVKDSEPIIQTDGYIIIAGCEKALLKIYDITGRTIAVSTDGRISVEGLKGLYIIEATTADRKYTTKTIL